MTSAAPLVLAAVVLLGGCVGDAEDVPTSQQTAASPTGDSLTDAVAQDPFDCSGTEEARFPDVVDVELDAAGDRAFEVSATLCSAYDTPERYADAWRISTPDGEVLGVRELLHDHADEQPFTRSLSEPIEVPAGIDMLVVEGRDSVNGWGGTAVEVPVPVE